MGDMLDRLGPSGRWSVAPQVVCAFFRGARRAARARDASTTLFTLMAEQADAPASSAPSSSQPSTSRQPHLSVQDLSTLNVGELDALSPQVISRQATINIGA